MTYFVVPGVLGRAPRDLLSVQNQRSILGKKFAVGDEKGWLNVKLEPNGLRVAIPEYLMVDHTATKAIPNSNEIRDYFTILEGIYRGQHASVRQTNGKSSVGRPLPVYTGGVRLKFSLSQGRLVFNNRSFAIRSDVEKTTPLGVHKIRIPDYPHALGQQYSDRSSKSTVWFYIGPGDRAIDGSGKSYYLHTGSQSDGCVTVKDIGSWDSIYKQLILAREGDGQSVGTIEVTN